MRYTFLLFLSFCWITDITAQNPGDTIRVQAWNFNSTTRDTVV